jgi:hypothetical protein
VQTNTSPYHHSKVGDSPPDAYHALPTQEIRNDLLVDVIQQASRTLVVISCINEEFPPGVVINERTNLKAIRKDRVLRLALQSDFPRLVTLNHGRRPSLQGLLAQHWDNGQQSWRTAWKLTSVQRTGKTLGARRIRRRPSVSG